MVDSVCLKGLGCEQLKVTSLSEGQHLASIRKQISSHSPHASSPLVINGLTAATMTFHPVSSLSHHASGGYPGIWRRRRMLTGSNPAHCHSS
ncbi:hypothetical protein PBY51_013892 [Eleginops maclovinus]|uniref:Uncharacterized protein n=1 Tax=Eleginops maclovinus TaxID=56733 RepID=A0AAN7ZXR5_ELEMC|nr:hypothetical protein PBY51_013892 [Eleginops maclovinus]